jgi:predicted dehydrogenase
MIGYGAIGYEHASAITATPGLELALVCDRNPARLDAARERFPDLRVASEIDEVIASDAVDAAIIGAPPNIHASLALRLLRAGKSAIVEKPFSITTAEADEMIAEAEARGLTLTCYQNRRWDPDFLAIQRAVSEGRVGDVFHVELFIGGFSHPCDYWHSHEPVSGGVFYDWGSHYLDWALTLLPGPIADVRASSHKRVWRDVTNADQASIVIRFRDGREVSFIHSDIAAALKPKWYALGTRGAITGHWRHETVTARKWNGDLIEERLAPSEAPPLVTLATRDAAGLIHEERLPLPPAPERSFHRNLADHLLAGEPLAINPRASRRNIAVMEAAAWSAAHESAVVPIDDRYA